MQKFIIYIGLWERKSPAGGIGAVAGNEGAPVGGCMCPCCVCGGGGGP